MKLLFNKYTTTTSEHHQNPTNSFYKLRQYGFDCTNWITFTEIRTATKRYLLRNWTNNFYELRQYGFDRTNWKTFTEMMATKQHLFRVQINLNSTPIPPIVILQIDRVGITVQFNPVKIAIANCKLSPHRGWGCVIRAPDFTTCFRYQTNVVSTGIPFIIDLEFSGVLNWITSISISISTA